MSRCCCDRYRSVLFKNPLIIYVSLNVSSFRYIWRRSIGETTQLLASGFLQGRETTPIVPTLKYSVKRNLLLVHVELEYKNHRKITALSFQLSLDSPATCEVHCERNLQVLYWLQAPKYRKFLDELDATKITPGDSPGVVFCCDSSWWENI